MTTVITWTSPNGSKLDVCIACEKRLRRRGTWPRDSQGQEYCQVSVGRHPGICDLCEVPEHTLEHKRRAQELLEN